MNGFVFKSLKDSERTSANFSLDVFKLVSGTTIAQVLGVLVSPILTRIYKPDAFGVFAVFTSITTVFSVIACLRYELAVMLPEQNEDAANVLALSLFLAVLVAGSTAMVMVGGKNFILPLFKAEVIRPYLWFVPVSVFLTGFFLALNYWNSRTRHFGRLSIARVIGAVMTLGSNIVLGLKGYVDGSGLIAGAVAGQLVSGLALSWQIWRDDQRFFVKTVRWPGIWQMMKRYQRFPLYSTWAALLNVISWQLPIFLLSYFFSSTVVGYYSLGFRILQVPMSLIGAAIAQVFFQRVSVAKIQGNVGEVVENIFNWLVQIGMFPMLLLGIVGQDLYKIAFGNSWAEAGVYTQILSVWAFFWFTSSPLSTLFSVLEKQDFDLKINLVLLVGRFIALSFGGWIGNARLALGLFAFLGIVVYGYWSFAALRTCGVSFARTVQIYGRGLKDFAPYGAALAGMYVLHFPLWAKAMGFLLALGAYGVKNVKMLRGYLGGHQT